MSDIDSIIREEYQKGTLISIISKRVNLDRSKVRLRAKRMGLTHPNSNEARQDRVNQEIMAMGLDPKQVDHGWIKTDVASIHFRNDLPPQSIKTLLEESLALLKKHKVVYPPLKRQIIKDKHLFIIDPADVHIGKLALAVETGTEYNIEIAKQRCIEGVEGLLQKAQGFPIEKIMLIIGNDILHFDTPNRTTTSGTSQDTDGMLHSIYLEGLKLYVRIIERLMTIADVEVVYNPSNHDYTSGYMLAQTLAVWFRNSKNVKFDVSIRHRKYSTYGKNLICTSHGDGAKHEEMPYLMSNEHPNWSNKEKQLKYIYLHHLHHKKVTRWNPAQDTRGVEMQILRSPSAPDGWHDRNGYCLAPQAVEGFIHHKEHGKIATLTHFFI
jgi:hypothetical protein